MIPRLPTFLLGLTRQSNVPHETHTLGRTDKNPGLIQLPPFQTHARRGRIRMMVVVPPHTGTRKCQDGHVGRMLGGPVGSAMQKRRSMPVGDAVHEAHIKEW